LGYWAAIDVLLFAGLGLGADAFYAAIALSLVSTIHFALRERSIAAFPVQVRITCSAILCLALWRPLHELFWLPALGTLVMVLFGYCRLARCLSLLPWNRREPLSWRLLRQTFLSRSVKGSVLQGLPANR
jgi:hypothetical protein